jgi:hypothetical protein
MHVSSFQGNGSGRWWFLVIIGSFQIRSNFNWKWIALTLALQ